MKNLLIVESPAKAKTIEKFLGSDFSVRASYGHIRDLPKDNHSVDIERGFLPRYEVSADKVGVVNELKKLARQADAVWLATDEDREGEAISWHLLEVLGLDVRTTKRIVFHEITKTAIQKAVQNPRTLDMNLVNAQQARRVLDRLVGFELSPIIWKKVKYGLSAGRVQSVAVRLIVEREREIMEFNSSAFYKVAADLKTEKGESLKAEVPQRLKNEIEAEEVLNAANGARFQVAKLEKKPGKRSPAPPFTTSTLQQEASRKLGYGVAQTMRIAQSLYENGHITYMRTDSVNLSDSALQAAKQAILGKFGQEYHQYRTYKTKTANAQEAHEAIRPTNFNAEFVSGDEREQKLYTLIWKRAVASQMADAQLEKTVVDIDILPKDPQKTAPKLVATGEIILFDGFLKLYIESKDDEHEDDDKQGLLPPLKVGQSLDLVKMTATERFTQHPPRYNEASLVKKLEELGIGRPSTYAPTISTVQKRNYVVKENREGVERKYRVLTLSAGKIARLDKKETTGTEKNKLFPTDLGFVVTDFLLEYFPDVIDFHFTASVEEEFDEISRGGVEWGEMLKKFYYPFHAKVEATEKAAERKVGERIIGNDPATGKPVVARLGRFGPLVQIGGIDDPDKKYASLKNDQRLETITLAEALELFNLPRVVGKFEDGIIKANNGRFGPYLLHNDKFISIPKGHDLFTITQEEAIQIIVDKRASDENKTLKRFEGSNYIIRNGRWNRPYLFAEGENVSLPKDVKIENLTLEDCKRLLKEHKIAATRPKRADILKELPDGYLIGKDRWGAYLFFEGEKLRIPKKKEWQEYSFDELRDLMAKHLAKAEKTADAPKTAAKKKK